MAEWKYTRTYWDYNIDHLAKYDIQAFIKTIYDTKMKELKEIHYKNSMMSDEELNQIIKSKLTITYVGHSLGGMTLPMYLIQ